MQIEDKLIDYLEDLCRLRLPPEAREDTKESLGKILAYIEQLAELDTQGVEALSHPFPFTNRFREDEAAPSLDRADILTGAPEQKDGYFKVPKTVE